MEVAESEITYLKVSFWRDLLLREPEELTDAAAPAITATISLQGQPQQGLPEQV